MPITRGSPVAGSVRTRVTGSSLGSGDCFRGLNRLAEDEGIRVTRPEENALVGLGEIAGKSVALAKPLSFMNLSGGPVKGLLQRYEVTLDRLLVTPPRIEREQEVH